LLKNSQENTRGLRIKRILQKPSREYQRPENTRGQRILQKPSREYQRPENTSKAFNYAKRGLRIFLKLVNVIFEFLVCREYQSLGVGSQKNSITTHRVKRK
jgi:hypothetical protein